VLLRTDSDAGDTGMPDARGEVRDLVF
jgi:hypothetical protein